MTTSTKIEPTIDAVWAWGNSNVCTTPKAKAARERSVERAACKGFAACELCGREIKDVTQAGATIEDEDAGAIMVIGPTCTKKLRKAGFDV